MSDSSARSIWQVGDWCPDMPAYKDVSASVAKGVYHTAAGTDAPLQAAVAQGLTVTSSQVIGAVTVLDKTGTSYQFAGTQKDLWLFNVATGAWTNKTKTAAGTYSTPPNRHWKFCQFGELVLACNGDAGDAIQTGTLPVGGLFADLSAGAPKARYIAPIEPGFVMVGYFANGALGTLGNGVGWSAFNDGTNWPVWGTTAAAAVQSDYQQLQGGGNVTAILPAIGGASGVVLTERAAYQLQYVGSPQIFQFHQIDYSKGNICPQGVCQLGTSCWYISEDGFIQFDGVNFSPIGQGKVDKFFFNDLDNSKLERVYAAVDFAKKCIIWAYPTAGATNGNPNRWLIYSYAKQRWRYCDDPAIVVEYFSGARTAGYTLDTLDTPLPGGPDGSGTFNVDDPAYEGGTSRFLAGFNASHVMVFFNGANLAVDVETGENDFDGQRAFVSGVRPITDAATVTCQIGYRDTLTAGLNYTTAQPIGLDAQCPQRISTRYARSRFNIAAGDTWTYLLGGDVTARPDGFR